MMPGMHSRTSLVVLLSFGLAGAVAKNVNRYGCARGTVFCMVFCPRAAHTCTFFDDTCDLSPS